MTGQPMKGTLIANGIVRCENGIAYFSPAQLSRVAAQVVEMEPPPRDLKEAFAIAIGQLMTDAYDREQVSA